MRNLRLFSTTAEADAAYASDYEEPWVSYTDENGEVRYDKEQSGPTYTFTWAGVDYTGEVVPMTDEVNHPFTCEIPAESYDTGFIIPTGYTDLANAWFGNKSHVTEVRAGSSWGAGAFVNPTIVDLPEGTAEWLSFDPNEVPAGAVTIFLKGDSSRRWTPRGNLVMDK